MTLSSTCNAFQHQVSIRTGIFLKISRSKWVKLTPLNLETVWSTF